MLKISIIDSPTRRRVVIEGKLIDLWAAELRNAWETARADLRGRELVVDLKQITAISQESENLLLELMKHRVTIRCSGVFTKHVLHQLACSKSSGLQEKTR